MTGQEFITQIEGYYGPYERKVQQAVCLEWALKYEYALDKILPEVMKSFSSQYKMVPDVSVFEKAGEPYNGRDVVTGLTTSWKGELRPPVEVPQITEGEIMDADELREEMAKLVKKMKA